MAENTTVSAPSGGDWQNVTEGLHVAVCVDVVPIWSEPVPEKFRKPGGPTERRRTKLVWEVAAELDAEGRPLIVSNFYTASLHEKAKLRQHLESWRGRRFTDEELRPVKQGGKGFDLDQVVGVPCQIQVVHSGDFANVAAIVKIGKGQEAPKPSGHYKRVRDREPEAASTTGADPHASDDGDVPF